MQKEKYEALEAEVLRFDDVDVITTSPVIPGGNTNTQGV